MIPGSAGDFTGRVNYAVQCLVRGTRSRKFYGLFEMFDDEVVFTAIVRRSRKNPRLMAGIMKEFRGEFPQHWITYAEEYRDIPDRDLKSVAKRRREEYEAVMAAR